MVERASFRNRFLRTAACLALGVLATVGCKKSGPPPLPLIHLPPPPSAEADPTAGVAYRTTGGTPIAPVVVNDDDPAPAATPQVPGESHGAPKATLNGDPNGITRETLNLSIQGAMGSLAACFSNLTQDPMVAVSFEADPSGRPSLLRVSGAPSDAEHCIRSVVQNIRFPAFEGKGVQVDLPLSFHRVGRPAQAANPAAEQQAPTQPSLFVQP